MINPEVRMSHPIHSQVSPNSVQMAHHVQFPRAIETRTLKCIWTRLVHLYSYLQQYCTRTWWYHWYDSLPKTSSATAQPLAVDSTARSDSVMLTLEI